MTRVLDKNAIYLSVGRSFTDKSWERTNDQYWYKYTCHSDDVASTHQYQTFNKYASHRYLA